MSEPIKHTHGRTPPPDTHEEGDGMVHAHITPAPFLIAIFMALIFLTFITVAASYFDFGSANTVIAVIIATIKASLVSVFFMHLRHDSKFNSVIFVSAFVFLGIFLMLTGDDLFTRGRIDDANGTHVLSRSGLVAPGGFVAAEHNGEERHHAAAHPAAAGGAAAPVGTAGTAAPAAPHGAAEPHH